MVTIMDRFAGRKGVEETAAVRIERIFAVTGEDTCPVKKGFSNTFRIDHRLDTKSSIGSGPGSKPCLSVNIAPL